jgi:hypothetical protein
MLYNISSSYLHWFDILFHNLNMPLTLQLNINEKNYIIENKSQIINKNDILLYTILTWTILYSIYKKCLNVCILNIL